MKPKQVKHLVILALVGTLAGQLLGSFVRDALEIEPAPAPTVHTRYSPEAELYSAAGFKGAL